MRPSRSGGAVRRSGVMDGEAARRGGWGNNTVRTTAGEQERQGGIHLSPLCLYFLRFFTDKEAAVRGSVRRPISQSPPPPPPTPSYGSRHSAAGIAQPRRWTSSRFQTQLVVEICGVMELGKGRRERREVGPWNPGAWGCTSSQR